MLRQKFASGLTFEMSGMAWPPEARPVDGRLGAFIWRLANEPEPK
jgi:hypothetical protein